MKSTLIAVIVIALAAGTICLGQDMVEYSHAAAKPAVGLQSLSTKINDSLQKSGPQSGPGPKMQNVAPSKSGSAAETAAKPTPPALFILANGKQLESQHYVLTAQNLVIQDGPKPQTISLSELNREATVAANKKRGLSLKFPSSTSQMTISF